MSRADKPGRIGVKPIQSNSLLLAQKKPGSAAAVFDVDIPKASQSPRKKSPRKSPSPGSKDKGKASARNSDDEEEDEDSGDEAEKLNDEQLNEIDTIYKK